jgi:hypothetical protein
MNNPKTRDDDQRSSIANQKQEQKTTEQEARRVVEGGEADQQIQQPGDNRTPDKPIGQVKYADNEAGGEQKKQGGSTRTSTLEDQGVRDRPGQDRPKKSALKSQTEGPAAYAPLPDEQSSADEARERRESQQKQGGG